MLLITTKAKESILDEKLDAMVYDFSFSYHNDSSERGDVVSRLTNLTAIAGKLKAAGWPLGITFDGLGFNVPNLDFEDGDDISAIVALRLNEIGIDERCNLFPGRTKDEVGKVVDKLDRRIWYDRKLVLLQDNYNREAKMRDNPDIVRGMLREMQKVEQEGLEEEFPYEDDFSWGMLNGRLAALRWVLGDDWTNLDT
jgi:hypothetical protein